MSRHSAEGVEEIENAGPPEPEVPPHAKRCPVDGGFYRGPICARCELAGRRGPYRGRPGRPQEGPSSAPASLRDWLATPDATG